MGTSHWWCSLEGRMLFTRYNSPAQCNQSHVPVPCVHAQLIIVCCIPFALHCCTLSRTIHGDVKTVLIFFMSFPPQIARSQLVGNELMIHRRVDATMPFIIKSDLDAYGTVEGAGPNLSFLKLQLGSRLSTCPHSMLPHYWQCTFQVHLLGPCIRSVPFCVVNCSDLALTLSLRRYYGPTCIIVLLWQAAADLAIQSDWLVHVLELVGQTDLQCPLCGCCRQ